MQESKLGVGKDSGVGRGVRGAELGDGGWRLKVGGSGVRGRELCFRGQELGNRSEGLRVRGQGLGGRALAVEEPELLVLVLV